ncbi:MAG TPA: hypothetical protein VGC41_07370 [Kofleriaceae bacterium]
MRWGLFAFVAFSCGGTAHQVTIGPPPARSTEGVFVGALCNGTECKCRDLGGGGGDGGVGVPADAAHKRFEIRLSSPNELWAQVGTNRLYKSAERPDACWYVDLPSGKTPVELRASNKDGAAGAWAIRELGTKTKSYYDSFVFTCGVPGVCSFEELDRTKAEYASMKKNLHDPCGSTKIRDLTWDQSKAPDGDHPTDVVVRLALDVYRFAPWKEHGDETCGKGKPPADAGSDAPSDDAL